MKLEQLDLGGNDLEVLVREGCLGEQVWCGALLLEGVTLVSPVLPLLAA